MTQDSIKFLELLLSDCITKPMTVDHNWRNCPRCLAINELEQRSKLATRYFRHAIKTLRATMAEQADATDLKSVSD